MAEASRKERKQITMRLPMLSTFLFLCTCSVLHLGKAIDAAASSSTSGLYANYDNLTAMQKHIAFFDKDRDGLVYLKETIDGMRAIGLNVGEAASAAMFINGDLSPATTPPGKMPSPLLPVYVENAKKGKHGSDSGAYDSEGSDASQKLIFVLASRFVPEKFEAVFATYGKTKPNALTSAEIDQVLQGLKEHNDPMGSFAGMVEWKLLYTVGKDKDGFLNKEDARGAFDGSLFFKLEKERSSS